MTIEHDAAVCLLESLLTTSVAVLERTANRAALVAASGRITQRQLHIVHEKLRALGWHPASPPAEPPPTAPAAPPEPPPQLRVMPLVQYRSLIEQALELERMAGEGDHGGPTYWDERIESTRLAMAHDGWRQPQDRSARGGDLTWALPPESCKAIHDAVDVSALNGIWRAAAKRLRRRAAQLKEELEAQAREVSSALSEISQVASDPVKP